MELKTVLLGYLNTVLIQTFRTVSVESEVIIHIHAHIALVLLLFQIL